MPGRQSVHELALCESVLSILQEQARTQRFDRVKTVWLQVGALSCAAPEALDFCFAAVVSGTLAEGARLEVIRTPGQAWCMRCGESVSIGERYDPCPQCGTFELQVTSGDEMRVKELEVE
jgi:hydrogenase nickel incorporation protein HypA/HybF